MTIRNINRHWNQLREFKERVWFPGSTQVRKGMGLCYDLDITGTGTGETATDQWGRRGNSVAVPDSSNNISFAGVSSMNYPAKTNGQYIDICVPGSICEVAIGQPTTIGTTFLTCSANSADAGRFTFNGLTGRGTAMALQTRATANGGAITFTSVDGTATSAWSSPSLTITATGIGTACGFGDSDIDPTEHVVVVLGGADDATGGDASSGELATTGAYAVVTAPTADTITIATDIGDCDLTLYVIDTTYPTCLAWLMPGPDESGCQTVITPQDATAVSALSSGCTFLAGGYTMAADSTYTLADGNKEGQRCAIAGLGTLTTGNYVVTVTSGLQRDGSSALASLTFDAAAQFAELHWHGNFGPGTTGLWNSVSTAGVAEG
jgi:hypothetical protein